MSFLSLYRLYISLMAGAASYFFVSRVWWLWLLTSMIFRVSWHFIERQIEVWQMNRWFEIHAPEFKQQLGPYGIRMINRAENEPAIRKSLAEVFTPDMKKLRKNVEQLELMDTLFRSGMRPDGDTYLLHDLKLKYGKYRVESGK